MHENQEPVLVIGGGVGPMAGVALHAMIIKNTMTDGSDQDHLSVIHLSCSSLVPDRTRYLLEPETASDPAAGMADVFAMATKALDGQRAVGGVPCNTFHAPLIYQRFVTLLSARLRPQHDDIRIVNMLNESVALLATRLGLSSANTSAAPLIGLLTTTGTRRSGVYDALLTEKGFTPLYVSEAEQEKLHAAIYDTDWGIKATPVPSNRARNTVIGLAESLVARGAVAIMPSCTELPLVLEGTEFAGLPLVDPVLALARALIREAAPHKLRPL